MVSKILSLLLNVLLERAMMSGEKTDRGFLANFGLSSLRRVLLLTAGILGSLMIFLAGLITVLLDLVLTSRDLHGIYLSQTSWVGLGLVLFSALCLLWFSNRRMWMLPIETPRQQPQPASVAAPLLDAVITLIASFMEDKRMDRELKAQAFAQHQAAASAAAHTQTQAQPHVHQQSPQADSMASTSSQVVSVPQNDSPNVKNKSSFN